MKRDFMTVMGALAFLIGAHAEPAMAEQGMVPCGGRDAMAERLETGYDEKPSALGLSSTGRLIEVYTSPSGTWSIIMTRPDGISCLVAVGESWQTMSPHVEELES